jgi:hypothetical protein
MAKMLKKFLIIIAFLVVDAHAMETENVSLSELFDAIEKESLVRVKNLLDASIKEYGTQFIQLKGFKKNLPLAGEYDSKSNKYSLLHVAASYGRRAVARELLRHGAGINALDNFNQTPLFFAVWVRHRKMVKFLLEQGACPNRFAYNMLGYNYPLHVAMRSLNYNESIIKNLIRFGAFIPTYASSLWPLHILHRLYKNSQYFDFIRHTGAKEFLSNLKEISYADLQEIFIRSCARNENFNIHELLVEKKIKFPQEILDKAFSIALVQNSQAIVDFLEPRINKKSDVIIKALDAIHNHLKPNDPEKYKYYDQFWLASLKRCCAYNCLADGAPSLYFHLLPAEIRNELFFFMNFGCA